MNQVLVEQRDLCEMMHLNLPFIWFLTTVNVRKNNALSQLPRPGKTFQHHRQWLGSVGEGGLCPLDPILFPLLQLEFTILWI